MNTASKKQTGLRLYGDQIEKLDMLVALSHARKDRSVLIREAIDEYIAKRLSGLMAAA